jgi:hypothetical protein
MYYKILVHYATSILPFFPLILNLGGATFFKYKKRLFFAYFCYLQRIFSNKNCEFSRDDVCYL